MAMQGHAGYFQGAGEQPNTEEAKVRIQGCHHSGLSQKTILGPPPSSILYMTSHISAKFYYFILLFQGIGQVQTILDPSATARTGQGAERRGCQEVGNCGHMINYINV